MRSVLTWFYWAVMAARRRAWFARRDHRGLAYVAYSAIATLGELFALATAITFVVALLAIGAVGAALVFGALALVLMVPRPLATHVAVPLGHHRLAYWLAYVGELGREGADRPARLAAARAAARIGSPPEAASWLALRRPARLDATEVAVQAVLAHGRGDRADARALFASIAAFADPAPEARELAAEWLAIDDAERGAWTELVLRGTLRARPARGDHRTPAAIRDAGAADQRGGQPLWPATPLTFLLEGVGARLLARPDAPSALGLAVRWLEAPARRATWPLVRAALRIPRAPAPAGATAASSASATPASTDATSTAPARAADPRPTDAETDAATARASMAAALRAHARALTEGTADAVADAALAWDAAIATRAVAIAVARRAIDLGASPGAGDRALAELDDQLAAELAAVIEARALPLPALTARAPGSAVLAGVVRRARRELLVRLELTCDRIGDRTKDARAIDAIDELRTFVAVRRAYDEAAAQGGLELERLAFPHVHTELLDWLVWLWNDRKEHFLSHLVTAWLYERALAVGDAEAIELHGSNGAIAIPGR